MQRIYKRKLSCILGIKLWNWVMWIGCKLICVTDMARDLKNQMEIKLCRK